MAVAVRKRNVMLRSKHIGYVMLSAVCVLALSGFGIACSSGESPTESEGTRESTEAVTPDPTVSSMMEGVEIDRSLPPTAEGASIVEPLNPTGPRRGGVLAAPMSWCGDPDPAIDFASDYSSLNYAPLVTEIHAGLTRIVDDPVSPFELELMDSYNVSRDGLEYEFILRNDLKFSDGSPLTSSDFKWSWERSLKKSDAGGRARDVFGLIDGAESVVAGDSEDLTGIVAVDDRTLKVRLTNPRGDFPALLADPVASVLKRENVELWPVEYYNSGMSISGAGRWEPENLPVGAGPFQLVDFLDQTLSDRCAIARNPHYWNEPAYLDGVWFRTDVKETETTEDGHTAVSGIDPLAFVQEATDYEELHNLYMADETEEIDKVVATVVPEEGIEVQGAQQDVAIFPSQYVFLVLNAAVPPFDDVHFRRAAAAYSLLTPFHGFAAKDARLITEELTTLEPTADFIRYDAEFAKSELAASKYAGQDEAWEVVVIHSGGWQSIYADHPSFIQWADELNLDVEEDIFGVPVLDDFEGRHNNKFHIRIYSASPAYPDPITVLRSLTAPFGKINRAPEFEELDSMLAAAASERDAVRRHELYLEIEEYVAEQALVIPVGVEPTTVHYRSHPWVHDLKPPKYPGSIFHKVWLDDTAPKRELPLP